MGDPAGTPRHTIYRADANTDLADFEMGLLGRTVMRDNEHTLQTVTTATISDENRRSISHAGAGPLRPTGLNVYGIREYLVCRRSTQRS